MEEGSSAFYVMYCSGSNVIDRDLRFFDLPVLEESGVGLVEVFEPIVSCSHNIEVFEPIVS